MKGMTLVFTLLVAVFALLSWAECSNADESFHARQYINCVNPAVKGISEPTTAQRYDFDAMAFVAECTASHGDRFLRHYIDQNEIFAIYELGTGRLVEIVRAPQSQCLHNADGSSMCRATNAKPIAILSDGVIILYSS